MLFLFGRENCPGPVFISLTRCHMVSGCHLHTLVGYQLNIVRVVFVRKEKELDCSRVSAILCFLE